MSYVRAPNIFHDPKGVFADYAWLTNHSTEEEVQASRQITNGAPTSDIGLIPQEGVQFPLVFQWKGTIFRPIDKTAMDAWYILCKTQSIYLTDFSGGQYEILITDWNVKREGVAANKRGGIPWLYRYTITIRVLRVIAGDWTGVAT